MLLIDSTVYLPTINIPETSMATIQAMQIKHQIGIKSIVVVCEQAIYSKTLEIQLKHQEKLRPAILRLGAFHPACTFMTVIGKTFCDSGLRIVAIQSGAIAKRSAGRVC